MSNHIDKSLLYAPSDYDSRFVLKLNVSAWLIIAFIMRPFIIFIASVTNRTDRLSLLNIVYPDHIWALVSATASIPTFILLIAWIKRVPHAGSWIRFIWHQGRTLLTISLLLNAGVFVTPWLSGAQLSQINIIQIGLCGILLYILWRSSRIRDTFAEFPSESFIPTSKIPSP